MLTTTRRSSGLSALVVLGSLVFLPAMAEAQLLPNLPIKRQRESCAAEPPFYAHVRRDYYGYFPTCWSKFPPGWSCPCPNPELPNEAAEYAKRPRDTPREAGDNEPGQEPDDRAMPSDPPAAEPDLPAVPDRGRAPFNLDTNPTTPDPAKPAENPSVPPPTRTPPPTTLREMPSLPAVAPATTRTESRMEPGSMEMVPDAVLTSNRPNLGPLPSMPTVNPGMMANPEPMVVLPAPAAAQAPQRRSLLGGLFGQGNRRRR